MQSKVKGSVTILGAGSFGTSLAVHLARQNYHVNLWTRDAAQAQAINTQHRNPDSLAHIKLSAEIEAFTEFKEQSSDTYGLDCFCPSHTSFA